MVRTLIRTQYKTQEPMTCVRNGRIILMLKLQNMKKYIFLFMFTKRHYIGGKQKLYYFELIYILFYYYIMFNFIHCFGNHLWKE
jgi:hypothetical protein